ncbi:MAG: 3-deoxy-7-phosphoheptulonate synthase [Candidatus Moraniibacteriota bacterium]|jgi:3-deoxy-7-phosphoheptulonate synthase
MANGIKTKKLMGVEDARKKVSLDISLKRRVIQDRKEVKNIISGEDDRLLVIVGPCSAWPSEAVRVYAEQLAELAKLYKNDVKIIMRVYTQKPRTTVGWAGVALQPDPFEPPSINAGTIYVRKMMKEIIELGLPIADEILFTNLFKYRSDMLSWAAIGARSSEDQEHRAFASGMPFAAGIKNPTSGDLRIGVNGVLSAQHGHVYVRRDKQIISNGNEYAHLVLRGGMDGSNYSMKHLKYVVEMYEQDGIENPSIIVDTSHDNTKVNNEKDYTRQSKAVMNVLKSCEKNAKIKNVVKGFLIESFVKNGNQEVRNKTNMDLGGLSITDACIGIDETRMLIERIVQFRKE